MKRIKNKEDIFFSIKLWWQYSWMARSLYWLRTHTYNRYHLIDVRGQDDYKWGYLDCDHLMYLACFKILCDFVEKEDPKIGSETLADYEYEGMSEEERDYILNHSLKWRKEVRELYDWWKTGLKKEKEDLEHLLDDPEDKYSGMDEYDRNEETGTVRIHFRCSDHPNWRLWVKSSDELEQKKEDMLMRLMKVRGHLWT